ncbi:MAG: 2-succinyl-5-enolpyruvyl-6-hydroxy-3-cyclohexene-1-carboxylic-acid synthase [Bacteroidaceae bacterium]|nr:2-succinyl-5-enolpyruvyl-6-hydroxy-3-cyclohexene-1-carboxylic-acid synthase [Bacteroidaceae bacterium]
MYTDLKSYQIIIALLKKYNISHCVLSAGSRNVPFVHSVEKDPFFKCYSVVDERSAGYFALGLAQQIQEPVVISCTSSTATCNYWPPIAEAYYQGVPIIILTSDRNPEMLGQWEDQMINQIGMFDRHVRKSVNLPLDINNQDDWIYCQRLVNEAFLELNHHGTGPVHINIPMRIYSKSFNVANLPNVVKIERTEILSPKEQWVSKVKKLQEAKRILILVGQRSFYSQDLNELLNIFSQKYNVAICVDHMSNIDCESAINTSVALDARYITNAMFKEILPEIVISFGGNVFGGVKNMLRKFKGEFEHWSIEESGKIIDMYQSITNVFECSPNFFFKNILDLSNTNLENNRIYLNKIEELVHSVSYPEFEYGNIYAVEKIVKSIPTNSILHLSINNSIRITNFFSLNKNIKTFANIGTHGIDGCLSSFLGQSCGTSKLSFLIIGDLAFFYDMNALRIRHIDKNVRILMINNHGGEEFYYNHMWQDEFSDLHTTARHNTTAEGWVKECGFEYISVHNKNEMDIAMNTFIDSNHEKPVFIEFFSEMKDDADCIYKFYELSKPTEPKDFKRQIKDAVKGIIGKDVANSLKKFIK